MSEEMSFVYRSRVIHRDDEGAGQQKKITNNCVVSKAEAFSMLKIILEFSLENGTGRFPIIIEVNC